MNNENFTGTIGWILNINNHPLLDVVNSYQVAIKLSK